MLKMCFSRRFYQTAKTDRSWIVSWIFLAATSITTIHAYASSQFEENAQHLAFTKNKVGIFDTRVEQPIIAPPAVDGKNLLVTTGKTGRHQSGQVLSINEKTGAILWRTPLGNITMTQAVVAGDHVIVGLGGKRMFAVNAGESCRSRFPHAIVALQATTGKIVWKYATRCQDMPTPTDVHHEILTPTGGGRFIALGSHTGKLLWQIPIAGWSAMSSPARARSNLYFGTDNTFTNRNDFYDINWRTHKVVWTRNFTHAVNLAEASPVIHKDTVFTAFMHIQSYGPFSFVAHLWNHIPMREFTFQIVSMSATTGQLLHQQVIYSHAVSPVQWADYSITSDEIYWKNWVMAALRKTARALNMTIRLSDMDKSDPALPGIYDPPLTAWHHIIYVEPRLTKRLYAIDAHTEKILWSFRTGEDITNPNIYHGVLYTVNMKGRLYVLDARTGDFIYTKKLGSGTVGPSEGLLSPHAFIVGGRSGKLISLFIASHHRKLVK